jgi:hypothetical protein
MKEILPLLGKYKYDTWRILSVKYYIDVFVRLWSCIQNIKNHLRQFAVSRPDSSARHRAPVEEGELPYSGSWAERTKWAGPLPSQVG